MSDAPSTTSEVIKLKGSRLSFSKSLFTASRFKEGSPLKFSCSFLIDPSSKQGQAQIKTILKEATGVMEAKFGKGKVPKGAEFCFGYSDGDDFEVAGNTYHSTVREYDGYEGLFYISSSNSTRPTVVDRDRSPLAEEDNKPYAGCQVNGTITLWAQNNEGGKRVNANLRGVQFDKDGEAFGVKPVEADDEFDDIEGVEEEGEDWDA